MAEHKHAAVLRAVADGKAVQFKAQSPDGWADFHSNLSINPLTHTHLEWRIKPEPKPDVVRYVNMYFEGIGDPYASKEEAERGAAKAERIGMICYVIDGETGKLKSAEVLP